MSFWWLMFVFNLLIPLVMIVGGIAMYKRSPKNINRIYGYRTARSMKNIDTWTFAHRYFGRIWLITGIIIALPTVLVQIPFLNSSDDVIGNVGSIIMTVQIIAMAIPIIPTETALKKTFFDDGTRK